jgi:hypothetical protein
MLTLIRIRSTVRTLTFLKRKGYKNAPAFATVFFIAFHIFY